ncbi:MAG: hypothetical protein F6K04_03030 [Leptolyngbya sp. SIO4C5]|uniref:hypothetical protein n=1 Tax=Sphaerothrix gracilis TaxID=3151835 RepID=UPI0013C1207B|nr:hypothetical protein [Leptolyngbya sp. SIO4C5]
MFQHGPDPAQPLPAELTVPSDGDRQPIRHILIGPPPLVERTKLHLHTLHYAEFARWTNAISIPGDRIIITPDAGHVMSLLVKLVRLE